MGRRKGRNKDGLRKRKCGKKGKGGKEEEVDRRKVREAERGGRRKS
jgi:hypothetical protein